MGEEEGGLKPIPIVKSGGEDVDPSTKELLAMERLRHEQRVQWVFLGLVVMVVLGFLTPLVLWLSRIALGN